MTTGTRDFSSIGVIGLGTMGAGIAEVFARNGYTVIGVEQTEESLERGRQHVEHSTSRAVKRGKLDEATAAELVGHITFTTDIADVKDCGLVVEAVVERLSVKQEIFRALDGIVRLDAILATNTSSLSVTEIGTATSHPGRVIGVHFFNPAPVQNLVEIIRTVVTEPTVLDDAADLARSLRKTPVVVGDKAGFIANALLFGYLNHAAAMFEGHYATREDLDAAMRYGCGYPMGPLALLDLIGLDTAYEILDTMYKQGRDRLHAPAPILKQMVSAGLLGRKSGRGFYTYEAPDSPVVVADHLTPSADDQPRMRHDIEKRRGGRHRHDGHRHRRGLRQGRLPGDVRRTQRGPGRRGARQHREVAGQGDPARQARGDRPRGGALPAHRQHRRWTTSARSTSSSRRSPRTSRSSRCCSRTSTRSASRARSWRPPPLRCR